MTDWPAQLKKFSKHTRITLRSRLCKKCGKPISLLFPHNTYHPWCKPKVKRIGEDKDAT